MVCHVFFFCDVDSEMIEINGGKLDELIILLLKIYGIYGMFK